MTTGEFELQNSQCSYHKSLRKPKSILSTRTSKIAKVDSKVKPLHFKSDDLTSSEDCYASNMKVRVRRKEPLFIANISITFRLFIILSTLFGYSYIMNSKYGEWKLVQNQFSQLVLDVAIFKEIFSHLKTKVIYK